MSTMTTRAPPEASARARILASAGELFYRDGFHAVGVDTIIAHSGVAKMSLYRHFPAKDDLIASALKTADGQFAGWLAGVMAPHAGDPRAQLEAIFDGVVTLCASPHCRGCMFMMTAAEFPDPRHPGHVVARSHKEHVRAVFARLARQARARDPETLADQLLLVMDGAFAAVRLFGRNSPAAKAASAARTLIAGAVAAGAGSDRARRVRSPRRR